MTLRTLAFPVLPLAITRSFFFFFHCWKVSEGSSLLAIRPKDALPLST